MTHRIYLIKDEVGMAIIAAKNPNAARQIGTWEWTHEPVLLGFATEEQEKPELIAEVIEDKRSDKRWSGKTLLARMWEELDVTYDRIMGLQTASQAKKRKVRESVDPLDILAAQNYALGLAFCIAQVQSPYQPSIDAVREQAAERWEDRDG